MKRLLALLFLSIFCGLGLLAQEKKDLEPKLLGIPLGITKTEFEKRLKAIAPKASYVEADLYINTPTVSGIDTRCIGVGYFRDKTYSYLVSFKEETSDDMLLTRHRMLKDLLIKKYGEPDNDTEEYDYEYLYNQNVAEKSRAIVRGAGEVFTTWTVGKIMISLVASRGRAGIYLRYSDIESYILSKKDKMNDL